MREKTITKKTPVDYQTLQCTFLKRTSSHKGISGRGILIGRAGSDTDRNSVNKRSKWETGNMETDSTWKLRSLFDVSSISGTWRYWKIKSCFVLFGGINDREEGWKDN